MSTTEQPPASLQSPARGGWLVVIVIAMSVAVAQAFGRFSYGVLLPAVRDDLQISNTLAGSLSAANAGAYLLGTLIVAWATSRYRLVTTFRLGLVLAAMGLLLIAVASTPLVIALGLFITGIGGAFVWIPAPIIAADALPPAKRAIAVGVMGSGIGLAIMFTSLLSGHLRSSEGDSAWSTVYQVQALIAVAAVIGVLLLVRHRQDRPSGSAGIGGFSALRRMHGWMPLIIAYAIFGFMYLLVIGFLTTRLEDDSGWSSSNAAFAFTMMGVTMIFGGPMFIALAGWLGSRTAISLAFGLWAIFVGIVMTGAYVPTMLSVLGLGLLFSGIPSLMTMYVVENTTVNDYGPSFAGATLAFGIAQMVSPAVGGMLADLTGSFTLVFVLSSTMGIVGLAVALKLPSKRKLQVT